MPKGPFCPLNQLDLPQATFNAFVLHSVTKQQVTKVAQGLNEIVLFLGGVIILWKVSTLMLISLLSDCARERKLGMKEGAPSPAINYGQGFLTQTTCGPHTSFTLTFALSKWSNKTASTFAKAKYGFKSDGGL